MQVPLITIGIPCYNAENTIRRAIESALAQTWPAVEILVVDDCSSDRSAQIIAQMASKNSQIKIIRHEKNLGVGGARDTVVKNAKGECIAFFDDDDVSHPTRLQLQYERIVGHEAQAKEKMIACYASGKREYPNGYALDIRAIGSQPRNPIGEEVADYLLFNGRRRGVFYGGGTPASALMLRKGTIKTVGGFDPAFRRVEDAEFAIRLALQGCHFIGCPEKLYTQFATTGGDKTAAANFKAESQIIEKHKAYLLSRKRYQYAQNWFQFRYHHFNNEEWEAFKSLARCWLGNPVQVTRHFLRSAPRRFIHELRMGRFGRET